MLRKRGNIWWLRWRVGGKINDISLKTTDEKTAKSLERISSLAREKTITREQAHQIIDSLFETTETYALPISESWSEYCRLVSASGKNPSPDTMKRREQYWRMFTDFCSDEVKITSLNSIGREQAVRFVSLMNKSDRKGKTRKNIIATIANVWNMLAIALNAPRIFDGLLPNTHDSEIREAFTPDEEARILSLALTMFDGKWYLASLISRYTGLRYSDVKNLEWDWFDENWVLRIMPNKKKAHGIRVALPIDEPLLSALKDARAHATSPYVLPGHALLSNNAHARKVETFADILRAANIDPTTHTFHSWRHTFRTRLAERGVSDDIAKRLGGWTQDRTALGYDHAERIEEARRAIYEK